MFEKRPKLDLKIISGKYQIGLQAMPMHKTYKKILIQKMILVPVPKENKT